MDQISAITVKYSQLVPSGAFAMESNKLVVNHEIYLLGLTDQ